MNGLDHIGLYVKDLAKSVVFYGEIFGFEVTRTMELGEAKIAFLDIGGGLRAHPTTQRTRSST